MTKRIAVAKGIVDFQSNNAFPIIFDFTSGTMPAGLAFARNSDGFSAQQSSSTVTTGIYPKDTPRFGRRTGSQNIGLIFEESRINRVAFNRNTSLTNGVTNWLASAGTVITFPFGVGPDGDATTATRWQMGAGFFSKYYMNAATTGEILQMTLWGKTGTGAVANNQYQAGVPNSLYAADGTWQRRDTTYTSTGATFFLTPTNILAQDAVTDMHQVELGAFPSEIIITGNSNTTTRAGEQLSIASVTPYVNLGKMSVEFTFVAKGAATQYTVNQTKLFLYRTSATTYANIDTGTRVIEISTAATVFTGAIALAWNRNDKINVFIAAGRGSPKASYRVNGGAEVVLTPGPPPVQPDFPTGTSIDLLCNGTTSELSSWIEKITFYATGQKPSWVS